MTEAILQDERTTMRSLRSCPVISTARVVLRPHRLTDADAIAQSLSDFAVARMLARIPQPYDRQDGLDWLQMQLSGTLPGWNLAITTGDDVHIGVVGLELRGPHWHLGYWLNRFYWGKGLMTEAVAAILDRALRRMPDVEIHSGVFADNPASLTIQQKLGFRIIGCGELFNLSRNAMVTHIETRLTSADFRRP
ncbi:RimJ/RimL family protein N-acetyltransferase [Pseudorhizobium tarimense]|uniref:RimJ/RimL family protein N-acetyltransferase n=1 Tax=Pseudorhizobium tarimense TaxID=1079109 RepID=A0ABV2H4R4_9HYPH|nr:GNAT family N-acetyltransferase [Pseudorhizobium tarimense]MCJ8518758.1 GNAT family N-acetyltransferase [Pseudorhizobium tarimense]